MEAGGAMKTHILDQISIRVKRKRGDEAPSLSAFILPHSGKKAKLDFEEAFASLGLSSSKRKGFLCELASSHKRKADVDVQCVSKKCKVVELQVKDEKINRVEMPVSKPFDEDMDYAIWSGFQDGQQNLIENMVTHPFINYQRESDGVTALMAACSYCNVDLISKLLKVGGDPGIMDCNGFDSWGHLAASLAQPDASTVEKCRSLLNGSEFVYDMYIVKEEVGLETDDSIWKPIGNSTGWDKESIPVADFEFNLNQLDDLAMDENDSDACSSDLDNEDDERYMFNDYPEDASESNISSESEESQISEP